MYKLALVSISVGSMCLGIKSTSRIVPKLLQPGSDRLLVARLLVLFPQRLSLFVIVNLLRLARLAALLRRTVVSALLIVRVRHLAVLITLDAELDQLGEDFAEVFEELLLVLGVDFDPVLESGISHERKIGRQHHKLLLGI